MTTLEILLKKGLPNWYYGVYDSVATIAEDHTEFEDFNRPLSDQVVDFWKMANGIDEQKIWDEWFNWEDEGPWTGPEMLASLLSDGAVTKDDPKIKHLVQIFRDRLGFPELPRKDGVIRIFDPENGEEFVRYCEIGDILVFSNEDGTTTQIYAGRYQIW